MATGTPAPAAPPAASPSAAAPANTNGGAPADAPTNGGADDDGVSDAVLDAFAESDPAAHLEGLAGGNTSLSGVTLDVPPPAPTGDETPPAPPANGAAPVPPTPPANGGAPTDPPQPQPGVPSPQELLARLRAQSAMPWAGPQPGAPVQPQPGHPQPGVGPSAPATEAPWQPFTEAVALPDQLMAMIDSEDPNQRRQGIGAAFAAFGNAVVKMTLDRVEQTVLPRHAQQTVGQVTQQVERDRFLNAVYEAQPAARYAQPALIQQAVQVVAQAEIAANPMAAYAPPDANFARKVADLVANALGAMGGGQPQPQPPQPGQPMPPPYGYAPMPYGTAPAYPPMPPHGPQYGYGPSGQYMPGPTAGHFAPPFQPTAPDPAREFAELSGQGWG